MGLRPIPVFRIILPLALFILVPSIILAQPVLVSITLRDYDGGSFSDEYTDQLLVRVDFEVTGTPTEMIMSEDPTFSGASWVPYTNPAEFTFTPGEGIRTLYAKVRDAVGESEARSDDIWVDTIAPSIAPDSLPPEMYDPLIYITYPDEESPPASPLWHVYLYYRFEGGAWTYYDDDSPPTGQFQFDAGPIGSGTYDFEIVAQDMAGNWETQTGVPEASTYIYTDGIGLRSILVTDYDTDDPLYTDNYLVRVTMDVGDPDDAAWMKLSEDPAFGGSSWDSFENPTTFTLSEGEGLKTVYCKLATVEFVETPPKSDTITVSFADMTLEEVVVSDVDSGSTEYTDNPDVRVALTVTGSETPVWMQISEDSSFTGVDWIPYQQESIFTLSEGDGLKTVYARVADPDYSPSNINQDTITLDTLPPNSILGSLPYSTSEVVLQIPFSTEGGDPPASPITAVELWYNREGEKTDYSTSALSGGSIFSFPVAQQPPDWVLYQTVGGTESFFSFDSSTIGGAGTYHFISIAEDAAGNRKPWPDEVEQTVVFISEGDVGPVHQILTPNGDGINDSTTFIFPKTSLGMVYLYIYSRERILVFESISSDPVWDGRDNKGKIVPGGIYIFQLVTDSAVYNGTVVVAR